MADQTKQTMIGGRGNTQIIGVPYQDFIAEMRRKDAEIARLTNDLTDALKNASDPQEKDDLQSRLDALRQKRDALKIRLSDPERAFNEHMQRGTQLAQILADTTQRHAIGENRINSAMEAFESFSYDEVKELFRESERLGRVQAASSSFALGMIEEDALNWQDALDHYERAYGQDPTFDHLQAYARLCWEMGRWRDAVPLFEKILKQVAQDSGEQGAEYAEALNDLALVLKNLGEYTQAEPLYEQALGIYRRVLGDDHPDTAGSLNNLAGLYRGLNLDPDRHRPVVDQMHLHVGAEPAGFDRDTAGTKGLGEGQIQPLAILGGGGSGKPRSVPARGVRRQGELADHQRRAANVQHRAVHLARLVLENADLRHLVSQLLGLRPGIALHGANQDHQTGAALADRFAVNLDPGPGGALQ